MRDLRHYTPILIRQTEKVQKPSLSLSPEIEVSYTIHLYILKCNFNTLLYFKSYFNGSSLFFIIYEKFSSDEKFLLREGTSHKILQKFSKEK